jgi:hypothetical protein
MVLFARRFLYQVNKRSLCGQGPHYFNAVPDPAIYLKADPGTTFHLNAIRIRILLLIKVTGVHGLQGSVLSL